MLIAPLLALFVRPDVHRGIGVERLLRPASARRSLQVLDLADGLPGHPFRERTALPVAVFPRVEDLARLNQPSDHPHVGAFFSRWCFGAALHGVPPQVVVGICRLT